MNNPGRVAASRNDVTRDDQESRRRKVQLTDDTTTWKKVHRSRKLWMIRGRISPNLGDTPTDLQSFVGEAIHVAAKVASRLDVCSANLTWVCIGLAWTEWSGTRSLSPIASTFPD